MGRMLEALKRTGAAPRPERAEIPPEPSEPPAVDDAKPAEEPDGDMPFIEVGPARSVTGSPDVLAAPGPLGGMPTSGLRLKPFTNDTSPPKLGIAKDAREPATLVGRGEGEVSGASRESVQHGETPPSPGIPSANGGPHFVPAFRPAPPPPPRPVAFRPLPSASGEDPADLAPELVAYHHPDHPVSGQYRDLLAALTAAAPGVRAPALLFTASATGAGTTTVVLNVAVTAARQGRRTAVVDANLRRPALADRLGVDGCPGLREVLAGERTLEESLLPTRQPGLAVLPAGGVPGTPPAGKVAPEALRSLLRQLRQRFDLVLVDGPRWDGGPEAVALGTACDAAYVVTGVDESPASDELIRILPAQGVRLAGCVVSGRGMN